MQKYTVDFSKVSKAESLLYDAQTLLNRDAFYDAAQKIIEARELLQRYLNNDPMVPDNDVYPGYYKANDIDRC